MFHKSRTFQTCVSLILLILPLSGCLDTAIPPPHISSDLLKLASSASKKIILDTRISEAAAPSESAGHQFLFLVIPFGRVRLADPGRTLLHSAYSILAQKDYRPLLAPKAQEKGLNAKILTVVLKAVSISAYDFIFVRRIRCQAQLMLQLQIPGTNSIIEIESVGDSSELRKFAFGQQLEQQFKTALDRALVDGFNTLGL